jgi:uncharacterized membrane protein
MKTRFGSFPSLLFLTAVTLWCGMLLFVPFLSSIEHQPQSLSHSLYGTYSHICHQYDSRSLHLNGHKLPVCARCSGIYFGFLVGSIGVVAIRRRWNGRTLVAWGVFLIPMLLDVVLNAMGMHDSTILTRILTGLFFGVGASVILSPLMIEGITEIVTNLFFMKGVLRESKT